MRILVAANLAQVRDLVADLSVKSCEFSTEFVSEASELEPMLNGGSVAGQIVVASGSDFVGKTRGDIGARLQAHPNTPVLAVIDPECSPSETRRILLNGASGAVTSDVTSDQFAMAAKLVSAGANVIVRASFDKHLPAHDIGKLSGREMQVLKGICEGYQNKEIAHNFGIKEVTVKMHVRAIIRKMAARNRTHAAMIARDLGLCF